MSSQLLGANASLNAPGGRPGAAPTVLQGSLISAGSTTQGNSLVNGTLTVVQPIGGGVRTAYFTDGNTGAAENSFAIFNDQTSTSAVYVDNGVSGTMTFEGAANAGQGEFGFNKPLRSAALLAATPAAPLFFGTPTDPATYVFNCPTTGGGTRALYITDNQAGALENSISVFLNQGDTQLIINDSGSGITMAYDGTIQRLNVDKPINHLSTQAGRATAGAGLFTVAVANADITANAVVVVTPVNTLGAAVTSPPWVTPNAGVGFSITWVGGAGGGDFSYFIAAY